MIANSATPAVAYLRRSTDKQEQSIADQRAEIARYAGEHGYRIVGEYTDDAISGTSAEQRPGFQKMIADAPAGGSKANTVQLRILGAEHPLGSVNCCLLFRLREALSMSLFTFPIS